MYSIYYTSSTLENETSKNLIKHNKKKLINRSDDHEILKKLLFMKVYPKQWKKSKCPNQISTYFYFMKTHLMMTLQRYNNKKK
jgi:hypothetical protein